MTDADQPLWTPSPEWIKVAALTAFRKKAAQCAGHPLDDYASLWQWSVDAPTDFWRLAWAFGGVIGEPGETVLINSDQMPGARWFPQARLNYAENLLRQRDESDALAFWGEDQVQRRMSRAALYAEVSRLVQALKAAGVQAGDRVAGYLPNLPEALAAMLATTAIGAIWSSASPDFGVQGVLDRFGQIEPKVLIAADGYWYNGKAIDCLLRTSEIAQRLPSVTTTVVVPYLDPMPDVSMIRQGIGYADFLGPHSVSKISFQRVPFDHPLFVLYSSGTTGVPKCMVHGHGGTLLQHLKEHQLHSDLKPGDRLFYFTTCGWMMWNWLMSGLASGATLLLYDGNPFVKNGRILFDFADAEGMTHFGTSAKFIDALAKANAQPRVSHRLDRLRVLLSTGSPLAPEGFDYVYRHIKPDLQLASISGGTDIVSCFVLGNPCAPVYRGEIQCRGLGMAVEVFDERGQPVRGAKGELVCTRPFPAMPVGFWNDPDGVKYRTAYFERFPGVWRHGDFCELTAHDGVIIYGRSDATLNPGGVRIGTAEIYRQVEQLPEIMEALIVGQDWDHDVRVVLFVKLREGLDLDDALRERIKRTIRDNATPRHAPAKIVQVTDIPRTRSGKIVELAVREIIHGRPVKNAEALANPEALEQFRDRQELQD
ncbi:MAG: acetoacetate--CoA ligase [Candidatus Competibacteraceae bacterium]|nr:acetoacetate--CoA ligase [Candidatus Competibacteraceae bacterium]